MQDMLRNGKSMVCLNSLVTRSDHLGQNGHNQNENPHGLQNHYHKVPILFKTMDVSVFLLLLIKKLLFVVFRPKTIPLVPSV